MKHRAKTYCRFISESAYVDLDGELHGLEFNDKDRYESDMMDQAVIIKDFLEGEGATQVRIKISEDNMKYTFNYAFHKYTILMYFDEESTSLFSTGRDGRQVHLFTDATESFFDLLSSKGLSFLDTEL